MKRILYYSHDAYGLGHIRRTLTIAEEVARRRPETAQLVLTGALMPQVFRLPRKLDYVKLPSVVKRRVYDDLPKTRLRPLTDRPGDRPPGAFEDVDPIWHMREAIIHAAATTFAPDVVLVDHSSAGVHGELIRTLTDLQTGKPRPALLIGLDDGAEPPEMMRAIWEGDGVFNLFDQTYDQILVYGDREVFDLSREYDLSPAATQKTTFTGYVHRSTPPTATTKIRERLRISHEPLVVVTAGGGQDGGALLQAYLAALRGSELNGVISFVVTGPLLGDRERSELEAAAESLPGVTLTPFVPDLPSYLQAADLVVTMAGYSAMAEVVGLGKRAVVVPRSRPWREQLLRAERFARRGLVTMVHPDELTPERLGQAVRDALAKPPPVGAVAVDGLRRVGDELVAALDRAQSSSAPQNRRNPVSVPPPQSPAITPFPSDVNGAQGAEGGHIAEVETQAQTWDGTRFYVNPGSLLEWHVNALGGYEIPVQREMKAYVRPGDTFIDCGANVGVHACPLARHVGPSGRVVAIEPVASLADRLARNCHLNDLDNVDIVRMAASSVAGVRQFFAPKRDVANQGTGSLHVYHEDLADVIGVDVTTIDAIVEALNVDNIRLIKIDVEGHEYDALIGAEATIRRWHPYLFVEFNASNYRAAGRTAADVTRFLVDRHGYRLSRATGGTSRHHNIVAHPSPITHQPRA